MEAHYVPSGTVTLFGGLLIALKLGFGLAIGV